MCGSCATTHSLRASAVYRGECSGQDQCDLVPHVQAINMHVCPLHSVHVAPVPLHIASWLRGDDMTCSSQARCTGCCWQQPFFTGKSGVPPVSSAG